MLPPATINFEISIENDLRKVYMAIQSALTSYKAEKKGPTLLAVQTSGQLPALTSQIGEMSNFPIVQVHIQVCYHVI